jgi:hypothetical protein
MEPKVADDLLWGVRAIAKFIGQSERMTYWRLENGQLPAGKSGNIYVGSRQALKKFFQELTTKPARPTHRTKKTAGMKKAAASG